MYHAVQDYEVKLVTAYFEIAQAKVLLFRSLVLLKIVLIKFVNFPTSLKNLY